MSQQKYAIVVTSINHPTLAVKELAEGSARLDADFWVIGDQKSPPDFDQPGARYFDLASQHKLGYAYCALAPTRHYARKNIGYLLAIEAGATVIIETDDDNIPIEGFWNERHESVTARRVDTPGWLNVYSYFSKTGVWPRGLPLDQVLTKAPTLPAGMAAVSCPIQQGLADDNPDVDAIYRLTAPLPLKFDANEPVALLNAWSPFNSQNTTWFSKAYPLLYLPYYCSFRMTDIWRSFVAQRIAYLNGWSILYHASTVRQDRNEHSLMKDFEDEIPGYLHNTRIKSELDALNLAAGEDAIPEAMRACYQKLVDLELIQPGEMALLDAWLADLRGMGSPIL